jgi:hypothetical protein
MDIAENQGTARFNMAGTHSHRVACGHTAGVGVQILRLGHDQYVLWSNTVEAPVGWVMNRDQMIGRLEEEQVGTIEQIIELLRTVDLTGSSDPARPFSEVLAENRAGPGETWLSVEEIVQAFAAPK